MRPPNSRVRCADRRPHSRAVARELPAAFEIARIAHGGNIRHGGERPDAAYLNQPLRRLAGARHRPLLAGEVPFIR